MKTISKKQNERRPQQGCKAHLIPAPTVAIQKNKA
jgi:hypothetical protein